MTSEERLVVSKMDTSRSTPDVQHSLLIIANFTWKIHVYGQKVPLSVCRLTTDIPTTLSTAVTVSTVIQSLDRSYVCIGNGDEKFHELQHSRKALRVVQASLQSVKGNCRGNVEVDRVECGHLRRRNSHAKH